MNDPRQTDTHEQENNAWLESIRTQLDASARDLDAHTLSRLNQARQQALLHGMRRAPRRWHWLMLASAASIALAVLLLPQLVSLRESPSSITAPMIDANSASVEDFELLTEGENLALYSDLDFYAWLDTQDLEG
jgi:hypothetical protein